MKTFLSLILGLALSANAFAYSSAPAGDPATGFRDVETKSVLVATVAGYNDAFAKGSALFYEDGAGSPAGMYQVSVNYSGTYNTATANRVSGCIATRAVATGESAALACATKGDVSYARYSKATGVGINIGDLLCISNLASSRGTLVPCTSSITSGGKFISLQNKRDSDANTGDTIEVRVQSE